jgi:hypothetical protein
MKYRGPFSVFFLPFITFGIYAIVWSVSTKVEMNKLGAKIPTAWLMIVPVVNFWWWWKYAEGVDDVTDGEMAAAVAFILILLLGVIGMAIIQNTFNTHSVQNAEAHIDDDMVKLQRLATLKQKGVLTDQEFQAKKKQVLGL